MSFSTTTTNGRTMIRIGGPSNPNRNQSAPICSVAIKTTATLNIQLTQPLNMRLAPNSNYNSNYNHNNNIPVPSPPSSTITPSPVVRVASVPTPSGFTTNTGSGSIITGSNASRSEFGTVTDSSSALVTANTSAQTMTSPLVDVYTPPTSSSVSTSMTSFDDVFDGRSALQVQTTTQTELGPGSNSSHQVSPHSYLNDNYSGAERSVSDIGVATCTSVQSSSGRSTGTSSSLSFEDASPMTSSNVQDRGTFTDMTSSMTSSDQLNGATSNNLRGVATSMTSSLEQLNGSKSSATSNVLHVTANASSSTQNGSSSVTSTTHSSNQVNNADTVSLGDQATCGSTTGDNDGSCSDRDDLEDDDGEDGDPDDPESSFNFIGWDIFSKLKSKQANIGCRRVLVLKDSCVALMFKAMCQTDKAGNNPRLLSLMADVAENCAKRLRQMRDIAVPTLSAQHMDLLPLSDGRKTSEHLAEISRDLGETVLITDVAYRFQPAEGVYIGTFVQGTVLARRNYAIGKVGVIAVLTKKSKFATVEAFSEQLCEHIACNRPASLGNFISDRRSGRVSQRKAHHERDQLLVQSFMFDPTIVVAEAARRCFVGIQDYLYFN